MKCTHVCYAQGDLTISIVEEKQIPSPLPSVFSIVIESPRSLAVIDLSDTLVELLGEQINLGLLLKELSSSEFNSGYNAGIGMNDDGTAICDNEECFEDATFHIEFKESPGDGVDSCDAHLAQSFAHHPGLVTRL